jgi:uncharacterized membrane protein (UPF0127 family)
MNRWARAGLRACLLGPLPLAAATPVASPAPTVIELAGHRIDVEVADTDLTRARGLMYRSTLPSDQGMLFVFPDSEERTFWMKNTLIPLDMLFFDENRRLVNVQHAVPCRADPCTLYASDDKARYVVELNAGAAARLGVKPGDMLRIGH